MKQIISVLLILIFLSGCEILGLKKPPEQQNLTQPTTSHSEEQAEPQRGLSRSNSTTMPSNLQQVALVVGNNQYEHSPLKNPVNDATDIARVLEEIGFDVSLKTNLKQRQMDDAIHDFTKRLSQSNNSVGLFYFAGHGAQVNGQNYLLPIDNERIKDGTDLEYHAVYADKILKKMEKAKTSLNIIILDACRDNPYSGGRTLKGGLAPMQQTHGSIIAFATATGKTASDTSQKGTNGLFTSHLISALKIAHQKHQRIDDMFMQISENVTHESKDRQQPWYLASLKKPFCFGGCLGQSIQPVTNTKITTPVPELSTPARSEPVKPPQTTIDCTDCSQSQLIDITSEPSKVAVSIDDEFVGKTPLSYQIEGFENYKSLKIVVEKRGFEAEMKRIQKKPSSGRFPSHVHFVLESQDRGNNRNQQPMGGQQMGGQQMQGPTIIMR